MTTITSPGIAQINKVLESLPARQRERFARVFEVDSVEGRLEPPDSMLPWIQSQFGSVEAVLRQNITKVTNMVTLEQTLFNQLRSSRPLDLRDRMRIEAAVIDGSMGDPLGEPLRDTPADVFGRVTGKHCITASNIAKYDGFHGIIIFDHSNPLRFTRERVHDYIDTGWEWAQKAHAVDPEARYYFFLWNCLRRAGASLLHGHAQVVLARTRHFAKIEMQRRRALDYRREFGDNYFDDLFEIHRTLGCGIEKQGTKVMAYLTPIKEKEVVIVAPQVDASFKDRIYEVLACFRDVMNVTNFNLVAVTAPMGPTEESWEGFPAMARVVDRGEPKSPSCDIGSMELYAASVVSSDPFEVARLLKESLLGGADVKR